MSANHSSILRTGTLAAALVSLTAACDPVWKLNVRIEVPASVQQVQAEKGPFQLLVSTERVHDESSNAVTAPQSAAWQYAVVCEAGDETLVVEWHDSAVGCSTETRFTAWLQPLEGVAPQDCEAFVANNRNGRLPGANTEQPSASAPRATATAFAGHKSNCNNSTDSVSLRFAAP